MNKKILAIFFTLLTAVMLTTPLIGTAQACRSRRPQNFEATFELRNPESTPYAGGFSPATSTTYWGPQNPAWINPDLNPDGYKYSISRGLIAWGTIDCGSLGIGKMTLTQDFWFQDHETSTGFVIATYCFEFDGDYGDYIGTLTGHVIKKTYTEFPIFHSEGRGTFVKGTGDLEHIRIIANVDIEANLLLAPPLILNGELTGKIWGLP